MKELQYDIAKRLYMELRDKAAGCEDEDLKELYRDFLVLAAEYGKTRLSWAFLSMDARIQDDSSRRIKHDGFMAALSAVCRNLGVEETALPDRKTKGDFACYIALFLSLEQR